MIYFREFSADVNNDVYIYIHITHSFRSDYTICYLFRDLFFQEIPNSVLISMFSRLFYIIRFQFGPNDKSLYS